jgi:hypothetical protein
MQVSVNRSEKIRGFYVDGDTVIVFWDGAGPTVVGTTYENTYAWIMTLDNRQVVDAQPSTTASRSANCERSIPLGRSGPLTPEVSLGAVGKWTRRRLPAGKVLLNRTT